MQAKAYQYAGIAADYAWQSVSQVGIGLLHFRKTIWTEPVRVSNSFPGFQQVPWINMVVYGETHIYLYIYIVVFHGFLSTVVVKIGVQPLRIKRWEDCTVLTEDCWPHSKKADTQGYPKVSQSKPAHWPEWLHVHVICTLPNQNSFIRGYHIFHLSFRTLVLPLGSQGFHKSTL